ncbi:MAG: NADH-quinone oxidoreductase subunit NuoH [Oligoflexia bacterium]|nr:NADH-quinone oxidoreductase subunit NuoH [Oligoflexia bacterium]
MIEIASTIAKIIFIFFLCLSSLPLCVWFERRGSAWIQGRKGPNRVGPFGLIQPVADAIKFFFKESFIPTNADKVLYLLAPLLALAAPVAAMISIPFGSYLLFENLGGNDQYKIPLQIVQSDSGILFVLAFAGLEIYPLILAGRASNNKYSILGALRGCSQLISYEIAMGLSILSMVVIYSTFEMNAMISYQQNHLWGVFINPIGALIFWVAGFAETNRLPFDLAEGDSEIVAGYHLEYGAMKFALFFMSEYVAMMMVSAFLVTLFFGGYALLPGMNFCIQYFSATQNTIAIFQFLSLFLKVAFFMFIFIWVRWTLPRFRFDQLMHLGWNILFPLSIINLLLMIVLGYLI